MKAELITNVSHDLKTPLTSLISYSDLLTKCDVTDEDAKKYDLVSHITKDAPPVFIAATAQDLLTPHGALPIAQKYSQFGTNYELHVFQYGPHGYALADETTADGSSQVIDTAFAQWHGLSVQWLHKTFGKPVHVDKNTSRMAQLMVELGYTPDGRIAQGHI
jgi:acetyl esterase/lipase